MAILKSINRFYTNSITYNNGSHTKRINPRAGETELGSSRALQSGRHTMTDEEIESIIERLKQSVQSWAEESGFGDANKRRTTTLTSQRGID